MEPLFISKSTDTYHYKIRDRTSKRIKKKILMKGSITNDRNKLSLHARD